MWDTVSGFVGCGKSVGVNLECFSSEAAACGDRFTRRGDGYKTEGTKYSAFF
jgi:hypothetical protein